MRPFLLSLLLVFAANFARAQMLDTLERLIAEGRMVDAKLYVDGIADSANGQSVRYNLLKGHVYLELYKQSVGLFGIKNNNWLATGCMAYMDGIGDMAKTARVPDSLFLITKLCYESSIREAVSEEKNGSMALADDLYYSAEYSAVAYLLLSGHIITDTFATKHLGLYFYRKGNEASLDVYDKQARYLRAKYYLGRLPVGKDEAIVVILKEINAFLAEFEKRPVGK